MLRRGKVLRPCRRQRRPRRLCSSRRSLCSDPTRRARAGTSAVFSDDTGRFIGGTMVIVVYCRRCIAHVISLFVRSDFRSTVLLYGRERIPNSTSPNQRRNPTHPHAHTCTLYERARRDPTRTQASRPAAPAPHPRKYAPTLTRPVSRGSQPMPQSAANASERYQGTGRRSPAASKPPS
jgi:hypothetical protein